jgi:putative transposase
MKVTRSQEQWRTILNEQQTSGQTIIDYYREHQLVKLGQGQLKSSL